MVGVAYEERLATAFAPEAERIDPATEFRTPPKSYFKICYNSLAVFLKSSDKAMFVQHLHFWHQNKYSGYLMKDGRKWIMNGYNEWAENFPWLAPRKIGSIVRYLEQIGWVISKRFYDLKRNVGFVDNCPELLHEHNQRKWYCLDYQKIYEDTGFDLLFPNQNSEPSSPPSRRKRSPRANVPKQDIAIYQNQTLQCTKTAQSSIYKEDPNNSHRRLEESFEKNEEGGQQEGGPEKFPDGSPGSGTTFPDETGTLHLTNKTTHEGQRSAAPRNKNSQKSAEWDWLPDGPWRTDSGKLDDAFLNAVAEKWVKKYGDTLIDKRTNVMKHFRNEPTNLPIEWQWYQDTFIHQVANIQVRHSAGMVTDGDEQMIAKNIRAALPLPEEMRVTETKSPEQVVEEVAPYALPAIQGVKNAIASVVNVPPVLPVAKEIESPQLETEREVDSYAVAKETEESQAQWVSGADHKPKAADALSEEWQKLKVQDANRNTVRACVPDFHRMQPEEHASLLEKFINLGGEEFLKLSLWHKHWMQFTTIPIAKELIPSLTLQIIKQIRDALICQTV